MFFVVLGVNSMGFGDLLDEIVENFLVGLDIEYEEDIIRVVIIGKLNVGKSFIFNKIFGEERVIVSLIVGIIRDVIDIYFEKNG